MMRGSLTNLLHGAERTGAIESALLPQLARLPVAWLPGLVSGRKVPASRAWLVDDVLSSQLTFPV